MLADFQNYFIVGLRSKFLVPKVIVKDFTHNLKRVAALPCEILMPENQRQSETRTVNF